MAVGIIMRFTTQVHPDGHQQCRHPRSVVVERLLTQLVAQLLESTSVLTNAVVIAV